jgi:Dolichyl-phosphate-mannose-protein mannosyltransferase
MFLLLQLFPLNQVYKKKPLKQAPKKIISHTTMANSRVKPDYHLIFLWIIILLVSIIRYRLIAVPFERDEGEYGYIGNLLLHGIAPFRAAYTMKLPGTPFMYSLFMLIFGHTNSGIHLGLVFINAATMFFLFSALKKIINPFIGLATASIYGFMSIAIAFDGFAAHATHFICFFSSIALFFLAQFIKSGKIWNMCLFGLMLGMAFLMKQQAVFLILFGAIFLFIYLKTEKKQGLMEIIKKILFFGSGVFLPYIIVLLIIALAGNFSIFKLWTINYASSYEAVKSLALIGIYFKSTFQRAWDTYNYFWILAGAGILVLYWSPYTRLQKLFVSLFSIASVCVLSSGFYFLPNYYIAVLPAIALLSSVFIDFLTGKAGQYVKIIKPANSSILILSIIIVFTIYDNHAYFFTYSPSLVCDMAYGGNPFNKAQEISKYISSHTGDTDKIAVLGSEPEIYFYANRTAATGYLYTYPLVENQPYNKFMQQQMIAEIEKNKPPYLIYCDVSLSWLTQQSSPRDIFDWVFKYTQEHYTTVGIVDFSENTWSSYWDDNLKNRIMQPYSSVIVLKRNPESKL